MQLTVILLYITCSLRYTVCSVLSMLLYCMKVYIINMIALIYTLYKSPCTYYMAVIVYLQLHEKDYDPHTVNKLYAWMQPGSYTIIVHMKCYTVEDCDLLSSILCVFECVWSNHISYKLPWKQAKLCKHEVVV